MKSKAEIRREIEKAVSEYTAKDLFSSPYFEEMLQATVTSVCEKLGRIPSLTCMCDETNDITAATNGLEIILNTQGPLIRDMDTNWQMYVSNIGHVVHETGHILFTDFTHQNKLLYGWLHSPIFSFYPEMPNIEGAKEVEDAMRSSTLTRLIYTRSMQGIVNVLEDAYVENRLRDNFSGLATAGLSLVNEEMYKLSQPIEEHIKDVFAGKIFPIQIADSILLARCVVGKEVKTFSLTDEERKLLLAVESRLKDAESITKALCVEQDGIKRCNLFNMLFVKLFSLMPVLPDPPMNEEGGEGSKEKEESGEDSSNGGSQNSSSDEAAKEMENNINEFDKSSGKSQAPTGDTGSIKQGQSGSTDSKERADALASSVSSMERELAKAMRDAATEEVLSTDEKSHAADLKKEASKIEGDIQKITSYSYFSGFRLTRGKPNKELYHRIYEEVERSSKNLTRKINNILKERETESVQGGFLMGQRFNASDVVNHDGKYFSRQIVPDGKAEVAFGILIDESGSMNCREKYIKARKAAVLLEDALRNLGIPLMVTGHSESNCGDCTLHVYTDFDTNDGKDPYRLAGIKAEGGNIDGAAITYIGEKLLKRPEKIKVLIVISDGLPAGCSFYDVTANEDTKKAIETYRKKGIDVFGAVVDSFEHVSALYGEQYCFDCREGNALENQLVRLIKRYVLMKG